MAHEVAPGADPYLVGVRGYRTTVALPPHTDSCDVVGLNRMRARQGRRRQFSLSATALYNEIAPYRPESDRTARRVFVIDLVGKGTA